MSIRTLHDGRVILNDGKVFSLHDLIVYDRETKKGKLPSGEVVSIFGDGEGGINFEGFKVGDYSNLDIIDEYPELDINDGVYYEKTYLNIKITNYDKSNTYYVNSFAGSASIDGDVIHYRTPDVVGEKDIINDVLVVFFITSDRKHISKRTAVSFDVKRAESTDNVLGEVSNDNGKFRDNAYAMLNLE